MVVLAATIDLHLPGVSSLKEKRGILKGLIARLHKTFNIAVAEVELNDVWQSAALGVAIVSTGGGHAQAKLEYDPALDRAQPAGSAKWWITRSR